MGFFVDLAFHLKEKIYWNEQDFAVKYVKSKTRLLLYSGLGKIKAIYFS